MRSGRFCKAATCLSLTLFSVVAPAIPADGQVINDYYPKKNTDNPFGPGLGASTAPTLPPGIPIPVAPTTPQGAAAAADQGQSAVWTPGGTTPAAAGSPTDSAAAAAASAPSASEATAPGTKPILPAAGSQPFSTVKDPLVTHPGVSDAQAATLPNSGSAIPGMLAPVFKPGSKAAIEQAKAAAEAKARANQPKKLYGRIEQLTAGTSASFPIVLKAMTAQMDNTPTKKLSGKTGEDSMNFSGTVAKTFPSDFRGNWGGTLTVWNVVQDPSCYKVDPLEATKLMRIFHRGAQGNVNFNFSTDARGGNSLAPAQALFMAAPDPAAQSAQMQQMLGGQSLSAMGPMGAMMQQMSANTPTPIVFYFGDGGSDAMSKGLSGNTFMQHVVSNSLRSLAPNVLEQQIVTRMDETIAATGRPRISYTESVLRFTKLDEQRLYVQAAQVTYWQNHAFKDKVIFYGNVNKGVLAQTNPYAAMMQGVPMGGQIPGAGSIFGGGGGGQMPQLPGGMEDVFKKMFGGQ